MIITVASFKGGVGKTTTALHLAAYFQSKAATLLVDGGLTRSALQWAESGRLPFKVVDEREGVKHARHYEHIVIDTPPRPPSEDLQTLAKDCDLLVVPCSPDSLAIGATMQMIEQLRSLQSNFKILLTLIPPPPNKAEEEVRQALENAGLPVFKTGVRHLAAFQQAALAGVPVNQVKGDQSAQIAWDCYQQVGEEITSGGMKQQPDKPLAKHKSPDYRKVTVYLPKALHHRLKVACTANGLEMSEVVEMLIKEWLREED